MFNSFDQPNGTTIQYGKYNPIDLLDNFYRIKINFSLEGMGLRDMHGQEVEKMIGIQLKKI